MIDVFNALQNAETLNSFKKKVINTIKKYRFFYVYQKINEDENKEIFDNFQKSKVIVIDLLNESQTDFFILSFQRTMILIRQSEFIFLDSLLKRNSNSKYCFLTEKSSIFFKQMTQLSINEIGFTEQLELSHIKEAFFIQKLNKKITETWKKILPCLVAYLIKESYSKLNENRIVTFYQNAEKNHLYKEMNTNDYVRLRDNGSGSTFNPFLAYHFEREEFCVIKKANIFDVDSFYLTKREISNYKKISHPFLPKFYGSNSDEDFLAIEYINGDTLLKALSYLNKNEKITIIFELMLVIYYLHLNNFILRDLKPDNIMIDKNKTLVLVDFDRMVDINFAENKSSIDFSNIYTPKEVNDGIYSFSCDIYSLGKVIYYIIEGKDLINENLLNYNNNTIFEIVKKCINEKAEKRPSITDLILDFYILYHLNIQIQNVNKLFDMNLFLEINNFWENSENITEIIYEKKTITKNIKKAIQFYLLTADQNDPETLNRFGVFYMGNNGIQKDIGKAIAYFKKAAEKNHVKALHNLGYYHYNLNDIQSAIDYFTRAADLGYVESQFNVGMIYSNQELGYFNSTKSIKYLKLAAKNNHVFAQHKLGDYYSETEIDIEQSIYYYKLASDQGDVESQYNLGFIYIDENLPNYFDVDKAIKFLELAANQNLSEAQITLGIIYYESKFNKRNIAKTIQYWIAASNQGNSRATNYLNNFIFGKPNNTKDIKEFIEYLSKEAEKNDLNACFKLGIIYSNDKYDKYDIQKSIYYFEKAAKQNHIDSMHNLIYLLRERKQDINKLIHYYQIDAINNKNKESQFDLGIIYFEGKIVTRDIDKAIYYLTMSANQHLPEAQYVLGVIYYNINFGRQDINKSIEYLILSSNQKYVEASFELFQIYFNSPYVKQDINKSINYLYDAIGQKLYKAYFYLGLFYFDGIVFKQDIKKAFDLFLIAADENFSVAQFCVGTIYFKRKCINKGIKYLQLAANQNYLYALFNLGCIYNYGLNVPKDKGKAIYYFTKAADQNHPQSQCNLGLIYCDEKSGFTDIKKGIEYYQLSANQNFAIAQYNLGCFYLRIKDYNKAIYYLQLAAEKKIPEAQLKLGIIYYENKIKRDIQKSINYLTEAANQKNCNAQLILGNIYFKDEYKKDIKKGINFYEKSSNNGNVEASFIIGFLYHEGKYIERDINKAIYHYEKASSFNNEFAKNNLGIIYKYGYKDTLQNIYFSINYFIEAIMQKEDLLSKYNLAHTYFYHFETINDYDEIIKLLIDPAKVNFNPAKVLLCLILIKKYNSDFEKIKEESKKYDLNQIFIYKLIKNEEFYDEIHDEFKEIDHLYDISYKTVLTRSLLSPKTIQEKEKSQNVTQDFYDGFNVHM